MAPPSRDGGTWRPFILGGRCRTPHATYPDGGLKTAPEGFPSHRPYSVLLPVGFTVPLPLPVARWALTPPFHPYPAGPFGQEWGGLLSVALSLGSPPAAVSRHRISMEPGLSSPTETGAATRSTGEAHMEDEAAGRQALAGSCGGGVSFMMRL